MVKNEKQHIEKTVQTRLSADSPEPYKLRLPRLLTSVPRILRLWWSVSVSTMLEKLGFKN